MLLLPAVCLVSGVFPADAERYFADYYYVPASAEKGDSGTTATTRKKHALSEALVHKCVGSVMPVLDVQDYAGVATAAKAMETAPAHQVAWGADIGKDAGGLFSSPVVSDDGGYFFLASVVSQGAFALRVRADLLGLSGEEALYVLDAEGRASFGPYTAQDASAKGTWLPTTLGDAVVLALHSTHPYCPLMRIETVSHFYKSIFNGGTATSLSCNIPINSETNPDALQVATGVGILIIPYGSGQGYCTGTLLNTQEPADPVPESYLLSSWHCLDSSNDYTGMEVFWDYRSESDDPNVLLRNQGAQLLSHNEILDAALMRLDDPVAVGPHGRAWVGWDTLRPEVGDPIQTVHYPRADSMKTSRGAVTVSANEVCLNFMCSEIYKEQIEVLWSEGVTEQGSSGSPLLHRRENLRVIGTLSNGPTHSCTNPGNNYDNYSSFSYFFPQIQCYLVPGLLCAEPYAFEEDNRCFIIRLFCPKAETVDNLRQFRDAVLAGNDLGKEIIKGYYQCCPALECLVSRDWLTRTVFRGMMGIGSAWGSAIR